MVINKMTVEVLCIGDPHFQVDNIPEVDLFTEKILSLANEKQPKIIVILGDTLHTHERLHTIPFNKANDLIYKLSTVALTYVLVGNHDYISNQQFLTTNHWLSGIKEWKNVVVVDQVITESLYGVKFTFVPYVPPGRFEEALNTTGEGWRDSSCIFAHQEFAGCKMGAITSIEGDKWNINYPHIVSGHIHSRQSPQANIYYPGSAMQNAFGESEKNIIAYLTCNEKGYNLEEINLQLPRKKILYMDVEDIDEYTVKDTADKLKLTLNGNYDQFKALKKTKKYKDLIEKGVKVVFKPKKLEKIKKKIDEKGKEMEVVDEIQTNATDFSTILQSIVYDKRDPYLLQAFEFIINDKQMELDDVVFL
jgi:DNA repair exonuclease SbcCD nuclease subunit